MTNFEYQPKRLFTLAQANSMLPLVRRIVSDIQRSYLSVSDRMAVYQTYAESPATASDPYRDEVVAMREELERQREDLAGYVDELEDLGVELKDPEIGLIDFPAEREGRIVYLCWKLGEPQVEYWHELEAGYRGRQPLGDKPVDTTA